MEFGRSFILWISSINMWAHTVYTGFCMVQEHNVHSKWEGACRRVITEYTKASRQTLIEKLFEVSTSYSILFHCVLHFFFKHGFRSGHIGDRHHTFAVQVYIHIEDENVYDNKSIIYRVSQQVWNEFIKKLWTKRATFSKICIFAQ